MKVATHKTNSVTLISSKQITAYSLAQTKTHRAICDQLRDLIDTSLTKATSKVWHGSPVWFIGENPIVGYGASAKTVKLLFWNGQSFDDSALIPVGKYWAAQAIFTDASEIVPATIRRWLKLAKTNVFDSKTFFAEQRKKVGAKKKTAKRKQ